LPGSIASKTRITAAVDPGGTFFDTAEAYGPFVTDLAAINDAVTGITIIGARYPEHMQRTIDR
jgi:diketogulonate reductase-like aldo/keto reductase